MQLNEGSLFFIPKNEKIFKCVQRLNNKDYFLNDPVRWRLAF